MAWAGSIPQNRIDNRTRRLSQQLSQFDISLAKVLIPYTGAQEDFDLGSHTFTTTGVAATGDLTVSSTLVFASGSITDSTGAISFGNENMATTGSVTAASLISGTLTVSGASIIDSTGAISFGNENLSTTGTTTAGSFISGTVTVTGASITDSTGAISFGNENLTTTGSLSVGTTFVANSLGGDSDAVIKGQTDNNLFYCDASTDRVGVGTATPATKFDVVGVSRLGDSATNYAQFAADGELTLTGTARVLKTVWLGAGEIKAPTANPATYIDHGIAGTWEFSDATDDTIVVTMRIPNDMDRAVTPSIGIRWSAAGVSPGNCEWQVEYLWTAPNEDTTAAAQETLTATVAASATANGLVVSTVTGVDVPSATDSCLHLRIKRLAAGGNDTIADTVELHGICMKFTSNKLGEAT